MNMMLTTKLRDEKGSALIIAVLILMVVTVLGILASRTSLIEQKIATSDKLHKMTWHAADAVADGMMPELIEQNIAQRDFGSLATPFPYGNNKDLDIFTTDFFLNDKCEIPSETNRDVQTGSFSNTSVYVSVFSVTVLAEGNAIQLPEGYHGRGKGLAGGGAVMLFTIRALGKGADNSEARVSSGWRHQT